LLNSEKNFEREYNLPGNTMDQDLTSQDESEMNNYNQRFRCHPWTDTFPSRRGSQNSRLTTNKSDAKKFFKEGRNNV
jgi:hypothetical protein